MYLYKQAIQLNHEFLADEAVNKTYHDVSAYQYLLLSKAAQTSGLSLTSNLNFQITKKRLLMMTKITSQSAALMKKAAIVPLFVALAFCLSDFQLLAQTPTQPKSAPPTVNATSKSQKLTLNDVNLRKGRVNIIDEDGKFSEKKYDELTDEEKAQITAPSYLKRDTPTQEDMEKWKDAKMYGVWLNEKRIANSELNKYKAEDIAHFFASKLMKNTVNYGKHYFQIDLMTNSYYENVYMKEVKATPVFFINKRKTKAKN